MTASNFNHVMIDLETLGTDPDCIFISLGAVEFDPNTGEQGRSFYTILSVSNQEAVWQRTKTQGTLAWWSHQSEEARQTFIKAHEIDASLSMDKVLKSFREWCPKNCTPWGNGATFDISILENAYKQIGVNPPWRFWNVRDVRTIVDLAKPFMSKPKEVEGTAHNAMDDAKHQAHYVSAMWQMLQSGCVGVKRQ